MPLNILCSKCEHSAESGLETSFWIGSSQLFLLLHSSSPDLRWIYLVAIFLHNHNLNSSCPHILNYYCPQPLTRIPNSYNCSRSPWIRKAISRKQKSYRKSDGGKITVSSNILYPRQHWKLENWEEKVCNDFYLLLVLCRFWKVTQPHSLWVISECVSTIQKYKFIQARFQPTLTCLLSNFEMRWAVLGMTCFIGVREVRLFEVGYQEELGTNHQQWHLPTWPPSPPLLSHWVQSPVQSRPSSAPKHIWPAQPDLASHP